MKAVCRVLGCARSHVHELHQRSGDWRTPRGDTLLLAEIREQMADLPSYGYRRACALVNRQRAAQGGERISLKRVRVMAQAGLLLPKAPRRRQSSRVHDGAPAALGRSDLRWCSDGLEIKCDSGQTVTATFAKDCCDREVMAWRAWEGKGLPGEPVPADHLLEFLTDNSGAYIAADTRAMARSLGLMPVNTPVCSAQGNGIAESFVNTFKCDYVARMDLRDAATVMAQLPAAFEHFNEVHPHSSITSRVQTASSRPGAPATRVGPDVTLRIGRPGMRGQDQSSLEVQQLSTARAWFEPNNKIFRNNLIVIVEKVRNPFTDYEPLSL